MNDEIDVAGKLAAEMSAAHCRLKFDIPAADIFMVVLALQFSHRNPRLSQRQKTTIERFARMLQGTFKDLPVASVALEQGWNTELDAPRSRILKPGDEHG